MAARVFLSLSYVDAELVRDVHSRLPIGLAHFYEESFENGEKLLHAMEKRVQEASVFVLFASKQALDSWAVQFEIEEARAKKAIDPTTRLLVFPTSADVSFNDLPKWMRSHWVAKAGYTAADIARYITTVLLEPNFGLSRGAVKVLGRGKTLDRLEQITADHLQRHKRMPSIYVLAGFTGIGRRTFASYYIRGALTAEGNLAYGPSINLPAQAELIDIYRGVRGEIDSDTSPETLSRDQEIFSGLNQAEKAAEVSRLLTHFSELGQAVTLISTSGFFEDPGEPKSWVADLFNNLPEQLVLFVVTNRQFPVEYLEATARAVQIRVEELTDKDIRALMIHTAERMKVSDLVVPDEIVKAIGGHPDVANSAVRLAAQRGSHVLERQPGHLFNVQLTILGEAISQEALSDIDRAILDALCWVPSLGGDILEEIVGKTCSRDPDKFIKACEGLVLSCLVTAQGFTYAISPAIRQLYRRWYVTSKETLEAIASVLKAYWEDAVGRGRFREDLFEAFVFMHAFKGEKLPEQLERLLTPGTLETVIKETYALGKTNDDTAALNRVVSWGSIADAMEMSGATREEILSAVARSQIRLAKYDEASATLEQMKDRGFASVLFLRGYLHRKRRDYAKAIEFLEQAVRQPKFNRSAVHELALSYLRAGKKDKLAKLLKKHGEKLADSAMFLDLSIGIDLQSGNGLAEVPAKIRRLRAMADDDGRADLREAQLMIRHGRFSDARDFVSRIIQQTSAGPFRLRALRAVAAIKAHDFGTAKRDIDFIRALPGREAAAVSLQSEMLMEQGQLNDAEAILRTIEPWSADEWRKYAHILENKASRATSISERQSLQKEADTIFAEYGKSSHFADEFA